MAVPGRTLTLYGVGQAPGCFPGLSATDFLRIAEGSVMLAPKVASGFSAYALSCVGNHGVSSGVGFVGVPRGRGAVSGAMKFTGVSQQVVTSVVEVERTTGSTVVVHGGGTQH